MRRLTILLAALTAFSCTSVLQDDRLAPIVFGTVGTKTPATEITALSTLQTAGIHVYGIREPNATHSVIINADLTYSSPNWSYGTPAYWIKDKPYYFAAWYPKNSSPTISRDGSVTAFEFPSYNVTSGSAEPLFWGGGVTADNATVNSKVTVGMKHTLSKITVKAVKGDEYGSETINVTSAKLTGMKVAGVFTYAFEGTSVPFTEGCSWVSSGSAYTGSDFSTAAAVNGITTSGNALFSSLQIPQTVSATIKLSVAYTVGGNDYSRDVYLSTASITTWESGKEYEYRLIIQPNYITFGTITVDEWGSATQSGGIIVR